MNEQEIRIWFKNKREGTSEPVNLHSS